MQVLCLGILVADLVARIVRKFPDKGKLVRVENMELHVGGCAANTGITLKKQGISTGIMGKVGDDGLGNFLIESLKKEGLDVRGIKKTSQVNTSSTMVMVDPDGERRFIHCVGANGDFSLSDVDWSIIKETQILHVAGSLLMPSLDGKPTAELLKEAKDMGKTTSLDTAWDATGQWLKLLEEALPYIDIFIPSVEEARMLSGKEKVEDIAHFFLNRGVKMVVLKMGKEGCYVNDGKKSFSSPTYPAEVIDTTGAGDAFVGGFLTGMVKGWDLEFTAKFANAVGTFCVQAVGATQGIKSLEETLKFLRERGEV